MNLIDLLDCATADVMRHQADARWETAEAFKRMLQIPEAQAHMKRAADMATAQPVLYQVVSVRHV
jgi:hypothetical protein